MLDTVHIFWTSFQFSSQHISQLFSSSFPGEQTALGVEGGTEMRASLQHVWMNRDPLLKGENYWRKYRRVSRMCSEGNKTDNLVQRNLIHSFNNVSLSIDLLRLVAPPAEMWKVPQKEATYMEF